MTKLLQDLIAQSGVTEAMLAEVLSYFKKEIIDQNSVVLRTGQVSECWYFIESGLMHVYSEGDEGPETTWLVAEGEFIASAESFFEQQPSLETIKTLEKCVCYSLKYADLRYLQQKYSEITQLSIKLMERQIIESNQRIRLIATHPAAKRYQLFCQSHPHLLERVKQKYLASYLSMSRGNFLAERKKIYENSKKKS
jgi:CRP-like cAMP-binding protein